MFDPKMFVCERGAGYCGLHILKKKGLLQNRNLLIR